MSRLTPETTNSFPALASGATPLDVASAPENPCLLLQDWVHHILSIEAVEPMYVTLATASASGVPSSRTVQLLAVEDDALLFTTNFGSRKGVEMLETGRAAVSLYWRETAQSVNITGTIVIASDAENDRRFAEDSRPVQAARTVSFHGLPLDDEAAQLKAHGDLVASGEIIPRPDYWRWYRLVPDAVTFWEGHPEALNRRVHYARSEASWSHGAVQS
ncbi:phenazine biosynthesis protein [Martelella alba]|uniref:Phenazine biosynthesis protein n=1 Tax=Martelella alba TaxID=2590451 RepID=A0A506U9E7_9HYPH|nr:pyridoxamine 5'-phosphate oxidase family protein [Martelella alba]TPW30500.1 phenazine biosynthesis protein [Martelella alba]